MKKIIISLVLVLFVSLPAFAEGKKVRLESLENTLILKAGAKLAESDKVDFKSSYVNKKAFDVLDAKVIVTLKGDTSKVIWNIQDCEYKVFFNTENLKITDHGKSCL